jgi:putative peptide maturation dehydrogenase
VLARDRSVPDAGAILRGELDFRWATERVAVSSSTEAEIPVSRQELDVLEAASAFEPRTAAELARQAGVDAEAVGGLVAALVEKGLLLVAGSPGAAASETTARTPWHPLAALYHFNSGWRDVHERVSLPEDREELLALVETSPAAFGEFIRRHGPPPPAFVEREDAIDHVPLEPPAPEGELFGLLGRRRTTRLFDPLRPVSRQELSTLLAAVFGVTGLKELAPGLHGLRRSSPSGGDLHPIEAYVLTLRVEDLAPGLHHYAARDHSLETLQVFDLDTAEDLAHELTAGQSFARQAGALVLLAGRFQRNYWKYRRHGKAYKVLWLEAGHLSQTFYLVAESLGLGAFFAGAINDRNAEERLALDPAAAAVLGILGCVHPRTDGYAITLDPEPYDPLSQRRQQ